MIIILWVNHNLSPLEAAHYYVDKGSLLLYIDCPDKHYLIETLVTLSLFFGIHEKVIFENNIILYMQTAGNVTTKTLL